MLLSISTPVGSFACNSSLRTKSDVMRLRVAINTGDEEVTDEDIDRAMGQMDGDGSGEVDFDECVYPAVAAQRVLLAHTAAMSNRGWRRKPPIACVLSASAGINSHPRSHSCARSCVYVGS